MAAPSLDLGRHPEHPLRRRWAGLRTAKIAKHLVYVSLNYAPDTTGTGRTSAGRTRYLAERGYDVTVIAGFPHYPEWRKRPEYRGKVWHQEVIDGVTVLRRWHTIPTRPSGAGRALTEMTFLPFAMSAVAALRKRRPDVVFGVLPYLADGVLASVIASLYRVPMGLHVQDLSAEASRQSGLPGARLLSTPAAMVEGFVMRKARRIAAITDGFVKPIQEYGVAPERISTVPNWTPVSNPVRSGPEVRRHFGLPVESPVALYAGNMGSKQGLDVMVEAAAVSTARGLPWCFAFVGDGGVRASLEQVVRERQLPNVAFMNPVPDEWYQDLLGAADVLLVSQRAEVTNMSLPSKLASYFAASRPVVAAVARASDAGAVLAESGAAWFIDPGDATGIVDALEKLRGAPWLQAQLGSNGGRFAKGHYSEERLGGVLEAFVRSAML